MTAPAANITLGSVVDPRGFTVVSVTGDLDVAGSPAAAEAFAAVTSQPAPNLVVDLSGAGFVDSTGLGTLVDAFTAAEEAGGVMRVVCPQQRLVELLRLAHLLDLFNVVGSVDEVS